MSEDKRKKINRQHSFAFGILMRDPVVGVTQTEDYDMVVVRKCPRCHTHFQRKNSLGHWNCRYHPCTYDHMHKHFVCCGRDDMGCVACDHCDEITFGESTDSYVGSRADPTAYNTPSRLVDHITLEQTDEPRTNPDAVTACCGMFKAHHVDYIARRSRMETVSAMTFSRQLPGLGD